MRRSIPWTALILLAAATGAVFGAVFTNLGASPAIEPRDDRAVAAARAFYDAVDEVLASGDTAALEEAVADDYVDHAAAPGLPPTRDGLIRALLDLRVTNPSLRIVPENLSAAGGRVVAQVKIERESGSRFLDLPLGNEFAPWGPIDLFGVAGGRIVEHWGIAPGARFEPLGTAPLGSLAGTPQLLSLVRWIFPPHTAIGAIAGEEHQMLVAASNVITVTVGDAPGEPIAISPGVTSPPSPVPSGTTVTLGTGGFVTLPSGASFRIGNDGDTPAVAVTASLLPPGAGELDTVDFASTYPEPIATAGAAGTETFPGGVTMQPLATGRTTFLPRSPAAIGVGLMVLAGDTELPPISVTGPALIAAVTGSVDLNAGAGQAWVRRGDTGATLDAGKTSLGAGDGASIPPDTDLSLRNSGTDPAEILVFVVMPVPSEEV
jgi:predicted SnoaL-like aldol condensation-catalyzing enzyme